MVQIQVRNIKPVFLQGEKFSIFKYKNFFLGFHEAIGEMIALSVGGPTHLQKLGLIQTSIDDVPLDINYLFSLAMDKLPFLPFAYVMDKWRWDVFKRVVSKEQFNCHWHSLRYFNVFRLSRSLPSLHLTKI